jgi:hypothetical protein
MDCRVKPGNDVQDIDAARQPIANAPAMPTADFHGMWNAVRDDVTRRRG